MILVRRGGVVGVVLYARATGSYVLATIKAVMHDGHPDLQESHIDLGVSGEPRILRKRLQDFGWSSVEVEPAFEESPVALLTLTVKVVQ